MGQAGFETKLEKLESKLGLIDTLSERVLCERLPYRERSYSILFLEIIDAQKLVRSLRADMELVHEAA